MNDTTTTTTDIQSLIGQQVSTELLYQEQADELRAADDFEGYSEWSQEIEEEAAWQGAQQLDGILIKRACEHQDCSHFQCSRSTRPGGIEI